MHEGKPFVSIVVPMYNSQATIESCLDSLINLDYPENRYEMIIVDDHSTDSSVKIVKDFTHVHDRIRLLRQREGKKGPAAARNLGIRHAKGDFIASTDSDEIMFPDWLNKLLPHFSDSKVAAVGALLREKHPLDSGFSTRIQSILIDPKAKPGKVAAGNVIYRKKILEEVGLFNEFCVFNDLDVDLHYRMQERGFNLVSIQKYLGQHKQRHSLGAFYGRMKGFGAAGLIISLFNSKKAFSDFENKKGIVDYLLLFSFLNLAALVMMVLLILKSSAAFFLLISLLLALMSLSLLNAFSSIKRVKSSLLLLPFVSFYTFAKMVAIIHGVFYGFFYYILRKR